MCQEESTKTGKTIGLLGPLHKISYYCRTPLPCQKRCTKRKLKETKGPHHGKSKLCISPLQGSSANKVAKERSSWRRLLFKYASDYSPFLKHPSVAVTHLLRGHLSFSSIQVLCVTRYPARESCFLLATDNYPHVDSILYASGTLSQWFDATIIDWNVLEHPIILNNIT